MSNDELNSLKQNIGQFISVNSFFSTSDERSTALFLLGDITTKIDSERVLFEIDADPKIVTTKPFADISQHSYFPVESEVLFMIGSIFRLNNINRDDKDQIWIIKMTLCNDDEHDLKQVLMYMKQQIESDEINLRTLGNMLCEMSKFDLAEKYLTRLLNQLPSNDPLHISLYEDLAKVASRSGELNMSVEWRKKLLRFKEENPLATNVSVIKTNDSIEQIQTKKNKYQQFATTVAGGNRQGDELNQLSSPWGICIDNNKSVYIVDWENDRIVKWPLNSNTGQIIAGGNGNGKQNNQLNCPTDVIFDKENNSFIVADCWNNRVIRYFDNNQTNQQIIISNIDCWGLTIDRNGLIYVSDYVKNEVRRWKEGDEEGELVAGGNGLGNHLNQLYHPTYMFIDEDYSLYISDELNNRVMKWKKDAKKGIIVAGGNGHENGLNQLFKPRGVVVDHVGQIYVADFNNHRVMRWCEGDEEGEIVIGGTGEGHQSNQLNCPAGLSFDDEENLYVVDQNNHRIQKYEKM
ncbi:unnamed protein product [Adineta steineri]|uniref:NHL repeat containing protein n=1 Tax=Adineta steineri TaxID=433720 RepID=A0A815K7I4_9BILA|nr:unnamed protein product [Adineta steineri]CAF1386154.1 unnamed protein product [Adineta steineri]